MKTRNILYSSLMALSMGISTISCDGFLDIRPNNIITGGSLTEENLPALTGPLYNKVWFHFNDKFYFGLGDGMSYNLLAPYSDYIYPFGDLAVTGITGPLSGAWASFYIVIQQSNKVIMSINASSASQEVKNQYIGEARFMRGLAYWHLASLWQNAYITEDPAGISANPHVTPNPQKDVYEYAIRDMEFAAKWLPERATQKGRIDRYSAFGMLSRFYLHGAGLVASEYGKNPNVGTRDESYLELARKAARKVIDHSSYALMSNYADLFKIENNNNQEVLFSLQWISGSTEYGVINMHQSYFAYESAITGGNAWGGATTCPYDMIKEYETADVIRRKATWMGFGDHYDEIDKANGGYTYTGGVTTGDASTALNVKKGVVGSPKDNSAVATNNSALNTIMMRLPEVYLNYADAILGNQAGTTDAEALKYFNAVRQRAGLGEKTSIDYEALRHERRIEFCLEGRYWYDLVARAYYKQQEVINYITGQNRKELTAFLFSAPMDLRLDPDRDPGSRAVNTPTAATFKLPYPESELIIDPLLNDAPVPFEFTEEKITDLFD